MSRLRTVALATLAAVSGLFVFAVAAAAHVTVSSPGAAQGGYAVVTFRVPNEEAAATTTKLVVQLPPDTPLASVAIQPIPGWTAVAMKTKLAVPIKTDDGEVSQAVSQITWTASAAAAIKPGEFQQFDTQLGPLPAKPSITFKALQTYSDGSVVRWIETAAAGTPAPDHPAPVLPLAVADNASPSVSVTRRATSATKGDGGNTGPIVLSIIALVLASGALGLVVADRARGRRATG
ncbi:MAG: YcnI family protein [Jatrophihabitans sp.]